MNLILNMNPLSTLIPKLPFSLNRVNVPRVLFAHKLYSTEVKEEIVIPKRIPRGPTDILRALESTIKTDPTAAHYKYHDDPFLIPMSNLGKRTFAMAQEAGRKAAHWVRQENADLFQHQEAEPLIQSFIPKVLYNENSEVTEEDLKNVIKDAFVSDASLIYKLLLNKGATISPETQQSLLELLCYYNHEDPLPEEFIEERWFRQSSKGKERQRKLWKDGMLSEEIFISIEKPNAEAYSAIIQGMTKYGQVDRAWQLFEESQQKGLSVSADAYNSIISVAGFLKEGYDLRWSFVVEMLTAMARTQTKPNLGTLNAVLKTLSSMGVSKVVKQNVLKTLTEFKAMGIEPSLASWYYVLITYCKERGPTSPILHDIMNQLERQEFKIRDLQDTFFFVTAMDICHYHLHDKDLAKRVNNLLHYGNNYDLIGDSYKESIYYRQYVTLLCMTEPLEEFMENVYHQLVPHIYVPEPSVMVEVLKSVEANGANEYLPQLWSDMVIFDHTDRENLIVLVLDIMVNSELLPDSELIQKFSNIAWDIWNKIENQSENRFRKLNFTGEILGKMMILVLKNKDFEKASTIMDKLDQDHQSVVGVPSINALSLFVDSCIEQKLPTKAINCIQYASDSGFEEAGDLTVRLNQALTLDETHLAKLSKIVGPDVLEKKSN